MRKNKKNILIAIVVLFIVLLIGLFYKQSKENDVKLDLTKVHANYKVKDDLIMFLYERYHPEDGLKFNILGSDKSDYFNLYYKNDKLSFEDFPSSLKNSIILDTINHKDNYDDTNSCYLYSLDEFKAVYLKNYGSDEDFSIDDDPNINIINNQLCIKEDSDVLDYQKTIDTYFLDGSYEDDKIVIYERVAFIKITDSKVFFYSDYNMNNEVYFLDKDKTDLSFIHNSSIMSNVLLEYKEKFPLYQYTYQKGESTYYFDSIEKQNKYL